MRFWTKNKVVTQRWPDGSSTPATRPRSSSRPSARAVGADADFGVNAPHRSGDGGEIMILLALAAGRLSAMDRSAHRGISRARQLLRRRLSRFAWRSGERALMLPQDTGGQGVRLVLSGGEVNIHSGVRPEPGTRRSCAIRRHRRHPAERGRRRRLHRRRPDQLRARASRATPSAASRATAGSSPRRISLQDADERRALPGAPTATSHSEGRTATSCAAVVERHDPRPFISCLAVLAIAACSKRNPVDQGANTARRACRPSTHRAERRPASPAATTAAGQAAFRRQRRQFPPRSRAAGASRPRTARSTAAMPRGC